MPIRALLILAAAAAIAVAATGTRARAQPAEAPTAAAEAAPERVRELLTLLDDPGIRAWLARQEGEKAASAPVEAVVPLGVEGAHAAIAVRLDATRAFLGDLAAAAPTLPAELASAWGRLAAELQERGLVAVLFLLGVFAGLGFGCEWLFWWATAGFRERMIATSLDSVADRLRAVGLRTVYGLGVLLAFALGSVGAFLMFDWPPLLRQTILAYLSEFLIVRLVLIFGRILLASGAERFRVVPMATATARFWFVWSAVLVGFFFFVQFTLGVLALLSVGPSARFLVGVSCGVVLLALTLFVVWRHPVRTTGLPPERGRRFGRVLLSVYLVAVWLLLFTGSATPFYVGVVLLLLPIAIRTTDLAVNHVLRPPGTATADRAAAGPSLVAVSLERGSRAVLLIGGAYLIAWIIGLDLGALTARETPMTRLLRGAINAVVILLLADFAWQFVRVWIDRKLAQTAGGGTGLAGEEARSRARLRTLLPIFRNILFVVLMVAAGLMALSGLGVQIGPLLAGAGVVGVAVGFGAQTLVKDVISGIFFLLDDAFRVGEYIESGSIRGTVESFSLRSVKLRHHRGYLHTVPFGSLEKITNYSRDWVIDKITLGVSYDTDLDQVKRITKQIGKDLIADPVLAPHILETFKMQGVEEYTDYAIKLRFKMMTRPGEQFVIRRRAYALIKKAFAESGIRFAFPTVQVAGGEVGEGAAGQAALASQKPKPAAA